MTYFDSLSDQDLDRLAHWLDHAGELFVHLEFPHSGGSGDSFLLRSLDELRSLLGSVSWPELEVFVFGDLQFPIRGTVDDQLIRRSMKSIPDGLWFAIVSLQHYYPHVCDILTTDDSHDELAAGLGELKGSVVGVGLHPLENGQDTPEWLGTHSDSVLYRRFRPTIVRAIPRLLTGATGRYAPESAPIRS